MVSQYFVEQRYVFMNHDLPDSLNLTCALLPNTTHGKWFWKDENGKLQNDPPLPPCAVSLLITVCNIIIWQEIIIISTQLSWTLNLSLYYKEIPTCTSVQEQMDPDIEPFTLDYVTTEQTTFITIQGDRYLNRSVPIRSTVNMTCYYEGNNQRITLL